MFVRSFTRLRFVAAAAAALALSAANAHAGVIASDVAYANDFTDVGGFTASITGTTRFATGFTTGTSSQFLDLKGVRLSLKTSSTTSNPVIQIFSGTTGSLTPSGFGPIPGTLLTTLSGPQITNTLVAQTFSFTGNLSLQPSTTYWVVLSANGSDDYLWQFSGVEPSEANSSGYFFVNGRRSFTGGATWSNNNTAATGMIEVQAVPEPSTIMLAGIGVAGALVVDRSRRQRIRSRQRAAGDALLDESASADLN
jgi:hypothetical protein